MSSKTSVFLSSLLSFLWLGDVALAAINVQDPISSQLPNIARVGQPFSWSFSQNTFVQDDGSTAPLQYSVTDLPAWVSFDSASRTFSGTPTANSINAASGRSITNITITARNSAGENASDLFSLLTMTGSGPVVNKQLAAQLPNVTTLGADSILPSGAQLLPLGWSFSLGFAGDSFTSDTGRVYLSAALQDGTDLPRWMHFDETVTFWGNAPTDVRTAGSFYTVVISASDARGYAGVNSTFELVVSGAQLIQSAPFPVANATAGQSFQYTVPLDNAIVNAQGRAVNASSIQVAANTTSLDWIRFDTASRTLSGTPPFNTSDEQPRTFTVPLQMTGQGNVTVPTSLNLTVYPSCFSVQSPPNVGVQPGKDFNVNLGQFLRPTASSVQVSYDPAQASQWIHYDASQMMLSGTVPKRDAPSVRVTMSSPSSDRSDQTALSTVTFSITPHGSAAASSTSSSSAAASSTGTTSKGETMENPASADSSSSSNGLSSKAKFALATSLGCVGGLIMLILLMMCCRKYCAAEDRHFRGGGDEDLSRSDCEKFYSGRPQQDDERTLNDESRSPKLFKWGLAPAKADDTKGKESLSPYLEPRALPVAGSHDGYGDKSPFSDAMTLAASDDAHHYNYNNQPTGPRQMVTTMANVPSRAPQLGAPSFTITNPSPMNEKPKRSSILNLLGKKLKSSHSLQAGAAYESSYGYAAGGTSRDMPASQSIGLGLEGVAPRRDMSQMTTSKSLARSVARSSWESNLFYDDTVDAGDISRMERPMRPSTPDQTELSRTESLSLESPLEVPVRRNVFGAGAPMRHRNAHINTSPAFNLNAGFEMSPEREDDREYGSAYLEPVKQTRKQMHGQTPSVDLEDVVVGYARKVSVEAPSGTVRARQQVTIQEAQRSISQHLDTHIAKPKSSQSVERLRSAFKVESENEDDPFQDAAEDQSVFGRDGQREAETEANTKRNSASSYVPDLQGAETEAIRYMNDSRRNSAPISAASGTPVKTRVEMAHAAAGRNSVDDNVEPEGPTLRAVKAPAGPLPPTPVIPGAGNGPSTPIRKSVGGTTRGTPSRPSSLSKSGGATISSWHRQTTHNVSVKPGELVRVSALAGTGAAPPMVGGAPGSPGKRSGRRLTYVPVLRDDKWAEYYNSWPEFLSWLSWDERMHELSGTVPPKFGPTPLTLKLAIVAKAAQPTPPSPSLSNPSGSPTKAAAGHRRTTSTASANSFTGSQNNHQVGPEDEVVATVILTILKRQ
ncbi:hypothetical protein BCV70DRAFT_154185 [Testicularia cyperi]|uniref:Dystroglycan-type cadherin-like domain-containing protein n=1 Tax=Testicularia cyperi TaxID=1882483 RepID=A0A317Y168_9BASI|nr:hypothetical protein BCV70DRAFT_154185 [Testicularia cyperi]